MGFNSTFKGLRIRFRVDDGREDDDYDDDFDNDNGGCDDDDDDDNDNVTIQNIIYRKLYKIKYFYCVYVLCCNKTINIKYI
jgi:hypothetical protein